MGDICLSLFSSLRAFVSNTLGVAIFPPEVFFLSSLPSKPDPGEVAVVVGLARGLSFLATLYPAWRAAQYDPVEALRLIGYSVDDLPATIHSYRMRFRGDNGRALDAEDLRILHSLASQVAAGR